tara:strand:+ start:12814 stop:13038 length:225 start_codon:yes stop_codon:yes gene_type:complete
MYSVKNEPLVKPRLKRSYNLDWYVFNAIKDAEKTKNEAAFEIETKTFEDCAKLFLSKKIENDKWFENRQFVAKK